MATRISSPNRKISSNSEGEEVKDDVKEVRKLSLFDTLEDKPQNSNQKSQT